MNSLGIKIIGLVGSGISLNMAATLLAKNLGTKNVSVVAVNIKSASPGSPIESTGPEILPLCEMINLNLRDLVQSANGTFILGTAYARENTSWFVPFGSYGLGRGNSGIDQAILKFLSIAGSDKSLDDFSLAAKAAKYSRFAIAGTEREDLKSALEYGLNLEASIYSKYLRKICEKMGVIYVDVENVSEVVLDGSGCITKVLSDQDESVAADFWVDISDNSILTREVSGDAVKECDNWLDNDVSYVFSSKGNGEHISPAIRYSRTAWGWLKVIDTRTQTIYEAICNKMKTSRVEAELSIGNIVGGKLQFLGARHHNLGWLSSVWNSNCLSAGNPAVDFGGLIFSELSFVQAAIVAFLDYYPIEMPCPANAKWFNRCWRQQVSDARDYIALHGYVDFRDADIEPDSFPQAMVEKVKLFQRLGKVEEPESDAVSTRQWTAFLYGMGLRPESFSLSLNNVSDDNLIEGMEKLRVAIDGVAKGMPDHKEFVSRFFS